jgi:TonB family protein
MTTASATLLEATWKVTVLFVLAFAAAASARRLPAAARAWIWSLAALGAIAIPILSAVVPDSFAVRTLPRWTAVAMARGPVPAGGIDWQMLVGWIYLAGVIAGLSRLARSLYRSRRYILRAQRFDAACSAPPRPPVLIGDAGASPMTCGLLRPAIVLPPESHSWSPDRLDAVLRHEKAHIARGDWLFRLGAEIASALYWFHPLAWFAAARLHKEQELACDDAVLEGGLSPCDYAGHLVEIARSLSRPAPAGCASSTMIQTSELEDRLMHILDSKSSRYRLTSLSRLTTAIAAAAVIIPLAVMQSASAAPASHVYKIGGDVTAPTLIHKIEPKYTRHARSAKIAGTVILSAIIRPDGTPTAVTVVKKLDPGLDRKAVEAVRTWKFEPARRKGKPVAVAARIEVNFRLK